MKYQMLTMMPGEVKQGSGQARGITDFTQGPGEEEDLEAMRLEEPWPRHDGILCGSRYDGALQATKPRREGQESQWRSSRAIAALTETLEKMALEKIANQYGSLFRGLTSTLCVSRKVHSLCLCLSLPSSPSPSFVIITMKTQTHVESTRLPSSTSISSIFLFFKALDTVLTPNYSSMHLYNRHSIFSTPKKSKT